MSEPASPPRLRPDITLVPFSSSATEETFLLTLPNGRSLQVSGRLVDLMNRLDGEHSIEEIASDLSMAWQVPVRSEEIRTLVDQHLLRNDLLTREPSSQSHSEPPLKSPSTKGILLIPTRFLVPLTQRLHRFFHPVLAIPLLWASGFCHYLFYDSFFSQAPPATFPSITPGTYLAGYLALFCFVLFHELGHLSASRHFHCPHGEIRFGLYLIFPVFYANVTPSWRLERKARLVVDLGGVYFQLILLLPCFLLFHITQDTLWMILILELDSTICFALNPFLRFDGYWVCSDLLGVPNLRSRSFGLLRDMGRRIIHRQHAISPPFLEIRPLEKLGLALYGGGSLTFFLFFFVVLFKVLPSRLMAIPPQLQQIYTLIMKEGLQDHAMDLCTILLHLLLLTFLLFALKRMVGGVLRRLLVSLRRGKEQKDLRDRPDESWR